MFRLKELREKKGLSLEKLSEDLHVNKSTLSRIENELREPKRGFLEDCAKYFNVSVDYLLGYEDKGKNNKDVVEEKDIEKVIDELLEQDGLMLCGEAVDEEALILLRNSIRTTLEIMRGKK
ncbi:helix-turn-helix domain-containing protein [Metaclostridioides mangenotii]|uniref:helix-turn-helix domain-containing protein n=1 Tax=Metaclostridioides mangenotii TaxID=1540 RepID=UPI0004640E42|nr:helix-turn-helix transcriptional regulator [Clostridioides mangenotii]